MPSSAIIPSPLGPLGLETDGAALTRVVFHAKGEAAGGRLPGVLGEARSQLDAYFARKRTVFDVPIAPAGTPFQLAIWRALLEIPYGETWSYAALAAHIGRPAAVRAAGAANGQNPIPIIIPCHRVIGSDGRLVGFGGGLKLKRILLDLEKDSLF
jgi:methylated-DNA-[protein]-cysteine S-methyltransferase